MKLADFPFLEFSAYEDLNTVVQFDNLRFDFKTANFNYKCLLQNNPGEYLFILFHGAKDRAITQPPYFDRWSWADEFPGAVLNISDPSLDLAQELQLAWYAGNQSEWPIEIISKIAQTISCLINKKKIVAYGSSNGGFAAIALQMFLQESTAIAINPQTNVSKYYAGKVAPMFKHCFGVSGSDVVDIANIYSDRFDLVINCASFGGSRIVLVQNTIDKFHFENHYTLLANYLGIPLSGGYSNNLKFSSLIYTSDKGHGPESRNMIRKILSHAGIIYENLENKNDS